MREIKFRAWDKKAEQMVGVLKLDFLFESDIGLRAEGYCDCQGGLTQDHEHHKHEIFPEHLALMQCTGLKAKDGRDVYEGDIVRRTCLDEYCDLEHVGTVIYSDRWCMYGIDDTSQNRSDIGAYKAPLAWGNPARNMIMAVEILGNIYENPELLTVESTMHANGDSTA